MMPLETAHLRLVPSSPEHILALMEQPDRFQAAAGFRAADGLADFHRSAEVSPKWLAALRTSSGADPWRFGFFVVHRATDYAIGSAGFKGPPDSTGMVEIAYGIVPAFEGRGYATESAAALVGFASSDKRVRLIRAHTLPTANASTRVLAKCGFSHVGEVLDPEDGPVWRWERGPEPPPPGAPPTKSS